MPEADPAAQGRKIHLLVVSSDTYPPTRVDVSVLFGEELAGRGHRIDWILQSEQPCSQSYATSWGGGTVWVGATDHGQSRLRRIRKHILGIVHDAGLFKRLGKGNYDLIEVKDKFIAGIFAVLAAHFHRKRFVYWLSYPFPEASLQEAREGTARYPFLYLVRGWFFRIVLYRILLPAADHVFVQSEQMLRDVAAEGIPPGKMTAVPMGIDTEQFANAVQGGPRVVIPEGERCFLYLGTMIKIRRMDFLIRVLALVVKQEPQVKLYLVGRGEDPSDEQLLVDEAARLGVSSSVVFVGQLPQAQALRYVAEADVCVSPFYPTPVLNSTSPTKLVEYMAMGKAVVANDHPEQKLVLEESGGGYCVRYDEAEFAAAILKLLRDGNSARQMGARGKIYALRQRSYPVIADGVERKLLELVP